MKKTIKTVVVLLLCLSILSVFAACTKNDDGLTKTVTVVVGEENPQVITVTTGAKYLFDVLNELSQRETDPVTLGGSWSAYGLYVTEVGGVKAAAANEYIAVLTSDNAWQDITDFAIEKEYDGKTVKTSSLGVSSLPLKDGEIYMFVLATF